MTGHFTTKCDDDGPWTRLCHNIIMWPVISHRKIGNRCNRSKDGPWTSKNDHDMTKRKKTRHFASLASAVDRSWRTVSKLNLTMSISKVDSLKRTNRFCVNIIHMMNVSLWLILRFVNSRTVYTIFLFGVQSNKCQALRGGDMINIELLVELGNTPVALETLSW